MTRKAFAIIAVLVVLGISMPARAKSFTFPSVVTDITVARDGSFRVVEKRTFDFDGSFRSAYLEIPYGSYQIDRVSVSEGGERFAPGDADVKAPGTYAFTQGGSYSIKWFYAATDEQRTFTISYRVTGAIPRYSDVAEFYWKFIGDRWDVGTAQAVARVHLPSGAKKTQLHVWGHGPEGGSWTVKDARTVEWRASGLPSYRFMEGRLAFPASLVPGAPKREGRRLRAIQAEEAADAENSAARPKYDDAPDTAFTPRDFFPERDYRSPFDDPGPNPAGLFMAVAIIGGVVALVAKAVSASSGGSGAGFSGSRDDDDPFDHSGGFFSAGSGSSGSSDSSSFGSSDSSGGSSSDGGFSDSGGGGGGGGGGGAD